jgi:acetyltransferase
MVCEPCDVPRSWTLVDGAELVWRPVRPADEALFGRFVAALSRCTRFARFLGAVHEPTPSLLAQLTQVDGRHHQAFIVTHDGGAGPTLVADARFVVDADAQSADCAIVVGDDWQRRGIGYQLLQLLAEAAARRGLRWLRCDVREDNTRMLGLLKRCGFACAPHPEEDGMVQGVKLLLPPYPQAPAPPTSSQFADD